MSQDDDARARALGVRADRALRRAARGLRGGRRLPRGGALRRRRRPLLARCARRAGSSSARPGAAVVHRNRAHRPRASAPALRATARARRGCGASTPGALPRAPSAGLALVGAAARRRRRARAGARRPRRARAGRCSTGRRSGRSSSGASCPTGRVSAGGRDRAAEALAPRRAASARRSAATAASWSPGGTRSRWASCTASCAAASRATSAVRPSGMAPVADARRGPADEGAAPAAAIRSHSSQSSATGTRAAKPPPLDPGAAQDDGGRRDRVGAVAASHDAGPVDAGRGRVPRLPGRPAVGADDRRARRSTRAASACALKRRELRVELARLPRVVGVAEGDEVDIGGSASSPVARAAAGPPACSRRTSVTRPAWSGCSASGSRRPVVDHDDRAGRLGEHGVERLGEVRREAVDRDQDAGAHGPGP